MQSKILLRKIPFIVITAFWFLTMSIFVIKYYFPRDVKFTLSESAIPKELYEDQWMGAYFNGEKIGHAHKKITKLDNGYKIIETLKVRLKMMGVEKDIDSFIDAETDHLFKLLSFVFKLKSDLSIEIQGRVEGKHLLASIDAGGVTSTQKIILKEPPQLSISVVPNIVREGLKPGSKTSIPLIDPTTLSQQYMEIEVTERDSIMSMGKRQDAYKVRGIFKGFVTFMWITEKGEVLREESPMGFTLVKESKENAIKPGRPSIDLIAQVAIPFNIALPREIDYLKVKLSGVELIGLELEGGRQILKGDILEIEKEAPPIPALSASGGGDEKRLSDEYLKETIFIQSKDPAIISLVNDIGGDEKDVLEITKHIHEWVYRNIKKVPIMSLPMATEVLRTRQGDCNEHTTLFTALARAAGIPTRIAVGLVYKDGFFYYHAWPEVYLNEWVAIDPTLGQFPADASHIRLLTGDIDKQLQLLSVIGKLRLEGIEYH